MKGLSSILLLAIRFGFLSMFFPFVSFSLSGSILLTDEIVRKRNPFRGSPTRGYQSYRFRAPSSSLTHLPHFPFLRLPHDNTHIDEEPCASRWRQPLFFPDFSFLVRFLSFVLCAGLFPLELLHVFVIRRQTCLVLGPHGRWGSLISAHTDDRPS